MSDDNFLQQFHNLAAADSEVRCKAALAVRQGLTKKDDPDNLQYAIKRLVRGVQSSRQCARQGFSLALSEVLSAFPQELKGVMDLLKELTGLQHGLKGNEQKDRMLGRLFGYLAIFNSGCLDAVASDQELEKTVISSMGEGLEELFKERTWLRGSVSRLLVDVCQHLSASGKAALVGEMISPWNLEGKVKAAFAKKKDTDVLDMSILGIAVELRLCYERLEKDSSCKGALQTWPDCIKSDHVAQPGVLENFAQALASEMSSAPLGDVPPFALAALCRWWLTAAPTRRPEQLKGRILKALDATLFPEKASNNSQVHGLRAFAELTKSMSAAAADIDPAVHKKVEDQVVGLYEHMPRGLGLLLRLLTVPKAPQHPAALYGHGALVGALGSAPQPAAGKKRGASGAIKGEANLSLSDGARLSILAALQRHKYFGTMANSFQRPWHQALLTPLSPAGVRERCAALMADLAKPAAGEETERPSSRVVAVQLEQLTVHGKAPDEVILAVMFLLFDAAYCKPTEGAEGVGCSLKAFCSSVGLSSVLSGDELIIPGAPACGEATKEDRQAWQTKFWSTLTSLARRPLPDLAEKVLINAGSDVEGEDGEGPGSLLRSKAYHGCLSDGSLLVLRLHEWWNFVTTQSEEAAQPKKKRKGANKEAVHATLRCVGKMTEEDQALRTQSVELAKKLLALEDEAHTMSSRQKNALANLTLCLSLSLMQVRHNDDKEKQSADKALLRDHLNQILPKIESMLTVMSGKKKKKSLETLNEALVVVPRLSAELFVMSDGLVKEAARTTWREFSDFAAVDTLKGLIGSIKDEEPQDEDAEAEEGEGSDGESSGEDAEAAGSAADAAKAAAFDAATAALKASREREAAEKAAKGEDAGDDSDDDVLVDGGDLLGLLGGDDDDEGQEPSNNLLSSFSSSGLQDAQVADGMKLTKKQQKLKHREEELNTKFRELDLIEIFVQRNLDKSPEGVKIIKDLHEVLIVALRRAYGPGGEGEAGGKGAKKDKRKGKADVQIRNLEMSLAGRVSKLLSNTVRKVCKPASVQKVCGHQDAEMWASDAKEMLQGGFNPRVHAAGGKPLEVGALMLYLYCAAHRSSAHPGCGAAEGWTLAEELLKSALADWSGKKDGDKWCHAIFSCFVHRSPELLLRLPWVQEMRASGARKAYVQRAQVHFVTEQLLQGLPPSVPATTSGPLAADFADFCAELLESTVGAAKAADGGAAGSAKQKLRREALRGLKVALRLRRRGGEAALPAKRAQRIASAVTAVRDALPARHGEVYQLCLHVLRCTAPADVKDSKDSKDAKEDSKAATPAAEEQPAKKRKVSESAIAAPAAGKEAAPKVKGGPKVAKGNKQFYKDM